MCLQALFCYGSERNCFWSWQDVLDSETGPGEGASFLRPGKRGTWWGIWVLGWPLSGRPFFRQVPSQLWWNEPQPLCPVGVLWSLRIHERRQVYCRRWARGNPRWAGLCHTLSTCQNALPVRGPRRSQGRATPGWRRDKLSRKCPQEWRKLTVPFRSGFLHLIFSLLVNKKTPLVGWTLY